MRILYSMFILLVDLYDVIKWQYSTNVVSCNWLYCLLQEQTAKPRYLLWVHGKNVFVTNQKAET